ncbi:MAG: hypothetical protein P1V81_07360, partial [Planctomycetota bacterium]|nr:hypothetical protein [Planctomycetota bacterium]
RHAGEVGRYPNLLEEALQVSRDLPGFTARLVAENRVFLEDSSPASRVRAFDWLKARGQAPPEYLPLALRSARRAALEAERAAAVAAAAAAAAKQEAPVKSGKVGGQP